MWFPKRTHFYQTLALAVLAATPAGRLPIILSAYAFGNTRLAGETIAAGVLQF